MMSQLQFEPCVVLVYVGLMLTAAAAGPAFHFDCSDPAVPKAAKFCDTTLDVGTRVTDIIARMASAGTDGTHAMLPMLETSWGADMVSSVLTHPARGLALAHNAPHNAPNTSRPSAGRRTTFGSKRCTG